jgi:hypothetical protein
MNKEYIQFGFIVLALIVIFTGLFVSMHLPQFTYYETEPIIENKNNPVDTEEDTCSDDGCLLSDALQNNDLELCDVLENQKTSSLCKNVILRNVLFAQSIEENNPEVCNQFKNKTLATECNDNFYFSKRLDENDFSYCHSIIDDKRKEDCSKDIDIN